MDNVFKKHSKAAQKSCCFVDCFVAESKCCKNHNTKHGQHKMKQLKSRKERSQMRGRVSEASKTKSHHPHQSIKNMAPSCNCCHSRYFCTSNTEAMFPNIVPVAQEPSIITDNRLIGHHGLFNHEVKSVDIERLLSEQRKQDKSEQKVPGKSSVNLHIPHNPSPFSCKDLGRDSNEVTQFLKESEAAKNFQDCSDKQKKLCHGSDGSDATPIQRPRQEIDSPSGSYKSIFSSKHSSLDRVVVKGMKNNSVMTESGRESQLSPTIDRDIVETLNKKLKTHKTCTLEQTPEHLKPTIQPTQNHAHISPSPLQLSSSPITQNLDEHTGQDTSSLSSSVSEVAAHLCNSLHFPFLRKQDLCRESREKLLRVLWERHGTQLQDNLLKVEQSLGFGADFTKEKTEDVLLPLDAPEEPSSSSYFDTKSFYGKNAEWLTVHNSTSVLDEVLERTCSPTFYVDSEPTGASAIDNLFSHSTNSCWTEKKSASNLWGDNFKGSNGKESFTFDNFENSCPNHSRSVGQSSGPQLCVNNIQPIFTYPAQLPDQPSTQPVCFPIEPYPFGSDRYSNNQSFSGQIHHNHLSNNFSQFTHASTWPSLRPHITDMMRYPPSYMLERESAPNFSSLPSPEHWSFPPMRLY